MGFLNALPGALAQGIIWGILAMGLYISYKILDIADLTVDGSICTGACVCAVLIANGTNVFLAIFLAFLAGALAIGVLAIEVSEGPHFCSSPEARRPHRVWGRHSPTACTPSLPPPPDP